MLELPELKLSNLTEICWHWENAALVSDLPSPWNDLRDVVIQREFTFLFLTWINIWSENWGNNQLWHNMSDTCVTVCRATYKKKMVAKLGNKQYQVLKSRYISKWLYFIMVEIGQQSLSHPHAHPLNEKQNHSYFYFSDLFQVFSHKSVGRSLGKWGFYENLFWAGCHSVMKTLQNKVISWKYDSFKPTSVPYLIVQIVCFYCQTFYGKDAVFSHLENSIFISEKHLSCLVITTL